MYLAETRLDPRAAQLIRHQFASTNNPSGNDPPSDGVASSARGRVGFFAGYRMWKWTEWGDLGRVWACLGGVRYRTEYAG